jgi:lysozyme|tara:strand:+ start:4150 stop:4575 length:426 start_codon:yes stop_codon:yes gene_type:complete
MDIDRLITQLKVHEGVRSKVYLDTEGIETIGVGRNLRDRGLSDDEIELMLANDIRDFQEEVESAFPWWSDMDDVRQRVVVDMAFNMGLGSLSKFVNTLAHIENGRYEEASVEMLDSKWARQVGDRANVLSDMMRTGEDNGY